MQRFGKGVYFFIVALSVIYSASWMLSVYKSEAQISKKTSKGVLGANIEEYKIPSPASASNAAEANAAEASPIPTLVPTSTSTPLLALTPTPVSISVPTPTQLTKQENIPQLTQVQNSVVEKVTSNNSAGDSNSFILDKINAYRASKGLFAVSSNSETCSFAKTRAEEIASNFNHDGFTQRINSKSLPYSSYSHVTENIAMNSNYMDVVDIWINSGPHAENMRADTPFICVMQNGNYFAYEGWKP
ncbi:MAG: hypothetical protein CO135_02580 [Candidatus Levybacteria bacterium CG_4_9_14_3_um_filter_35_16]|nr:MAG: hypothetical protein COW87_02345 [Candidatus Levybacteria bacterium CG22_combo_CG10-13_8_21_14_all_35_11]PJA91148.1 MAG: hypothetical protein CO135_02580 [Candidatus Levybacteria bacterium CG_4_9_14_3_um_filter_35_16]PJC54026.1 MAG: hypothetical protein CO028_04410 [Candidatus Levybacteria bacterium CG_4_9_14_0_2_um_filter_35_21]